MEKLRVRCPSCFKLYEVEAEDIRSSQPQFECVACYERFTFDFPPVDASRIFARKVQTTVAAPITAPSAATSNVAAPVIDSVAFISTASGQRLEKNEIETDVVEIAESKKSCPKCGALANPGARECYSCGVIFARVDGLPSDKTLGAQPSLVEKWKVLASDFENSELHNEFILACRELRALRFALKQYEEMESALGSDQRCREAKIRIQAMINMETENEIVKFKGHFDSINWKLIGRVSPFVISALMVFLGLLRLGNRNLVGAGVMLFLMSLGTLHLIKGRISLEDILKSKD